jgi:hypothetical protein
VDAKDKVRSGIPQLSQSLPNNLLWGRRGTRSSLTQHCRGKVVWRRILRDEDRLTVDVTPPPFIRRLKRRPLPENGATPQGRRKFRMHTNLCTRLSIRTDHTKALSTRKVDKINPSDQDGGESRGRWGERSPGKCKRARRVAVRSRAK